MTFKRARQAEQKAERKAGILSKARELCSEKGILNWSLNELGQRADVTKSNLYRYFGSREEILMTLLTQETNSFVTSFETAMKDRVLSANELGREIAQQYCKQPFLCDLLSLSSSLFEHNVELERVRDIKLNSLSDMEIITKTISNCLPNCTEEEASQIAFTSGVIASGLWPMANPQAPLQKLSQLPGLERLHFDFATQMEQMMSAYILGLHHE